MACTALTDLRLDNNGIGEKGARALTPVWASRSVRHLTILSASDNNLGVSMQMYMYIYYTHAHTNEGVCHCWLPDLYLFDCGLGQNNQIVSMLNMHVSGDMPVSLYACVCVYKTPYAYACMHICKQFTDLVLSLVSLLR